MNVSDLKFTKDHEWVKVDGDSITVGISDYAQKELGDVVYVELPETGNNLASGDTCSNIESVKAVSDIYAPLSGEIVAANEGLEDKPELINQDPYGDGWIFKMALSDKSELDGLLSNEQYSEYLDGITKE